MGVVQGTRPLAHKIPARIERPNKLQSIYRHYEHYLKKAFNETRKLSDTDGDVVERLKKRGNIPGDKIVKMETFLNRYHGARFGGKEPLNLEEMIRSM